MYSLQRVGHLAAVTLAALTLGACATMSVSSFTTRGIDFTQYRTYDWAPGEPGPTGDARLDNNPFFFERLRAVVDRQLAAKGFEKGSGAPALTLHYHASVSQRLDLSNVASKDGDECTGCGPFVYDEGSLVLDLVDTKTTKLIWRGWASGSIDGVVDRQDRMEEIIDRAVARIFERLPSGS